MVRNQVRHGSGKAITLPSGMSFRKAIMVLHTEQELQEYDEAPIEVEEKIEGYPYEAAYALDLAAKEIFGATVQFNRPTEDGVIKARLIGIPISTSQTVQVPWGPFRVPEVEGYFETTFAAGEDGAPVMQLNAEVLRKYKKEVHKLAALTRKILKREKLYQGKALKIRFRDDAGDYVIDPPTFMNLEGDFTTIFSRDIERALEVNLFMPIQHPDILKEMNIPKKRGVLLRGTYGSGKTLTAYMVAKAATTAGRTFIYVQNAFELPDALLFARKYAPAVVFCEDIDRVTVGSRTKEMDRLFNIVDGVDTKSSDVLTVLTTNNVELIHPAFLREGRMDAVIEIDKLDADAAERLIRHFGKGLIDKNEDLTRIAHQVSDGTPARIREIVERSKLEKAYQSVSDGSPRDVLTARDIEFTYHRLREERGGIEEAMQQSEEMHTIHNLASQLGGQLRVRTNGDARGHHS